MTALQLQTGIIYGPVHSRRLGRSLGINLLPCTYKLCSFACVYCHYGRTPAKTVTVAGPSVPQADLPSTEQVLEAVAAALHAHRDVDIDYLTFSGNGEATLHPHFPAIVSGVRGLRDRLRPGAKLALLSNSTTAHEPHIREAFSFIDVPIMKLDAGDPRTLAGINRPAPGVRLERIIEGLKRVPHLTIQSVLVEGKVTNIRGEAFASWVSTLAEIQPAQVQIYSTDRPGSEAGVERVPPSTLQRLATEIRARTGLQVTAYWAGA